MHYRSPYAAHTDHNRNGVQHCRHTDLPRRKTIATMSLLHEIDPRLRDTATAATTATPTTAFSQRPPSSSHSAAIAPNLAISPTSQQQPQQQQHYPPIQDGPPLQPLYPYSPQPADNDPDRDGGNGLHDGGPNDPKRPRACEACRGLKVRCDPNVADPDGPCKVRN